MKLLGILMAVMLCLVLTSAWAEAESFDSVLWKRFTVYGGAQMYNAEGEFKSTRAGKPGTSIDLNDLGLDDDKITPVAGAILNFWGKRMTLRFDYFGYHDDANATADFSFDFDGETYPINARLNSNLDIDIYALNLSYNLYRSDRARLGVGLGLHLADLDLGLSGSVNGVTVASGSTDVLAPLPNIYVTGDYAFTEKFLLRAGAGGLSLSYGDWDGNMFFIEGFLEYWPWKHVGFGAGYRYLGIDVNYEPSSKKETYDFSLPGPMAYVTVGF